MRIISTVIFLGVGLAAREVAGISGMDTPPEASAPHQTSFVKPKETKLPNGLRVIVAERPGLPLLAAEMLIRSGAEVDPQGRGGTADITGSLLTKGTEKMSAPQIANAIESLGAQIFSGGDWDSSYAGVVCMSDKAEAAFEIFSDVVLHPTFKDEELERLRKQALDRFRLEMQEPGAIADYARVQVVFPVGEYSHPRTGTTETLQGIGRDDVVKLYRTWYRPDNAVLVLVGDLSLERGKEFAQKYFGQWKTDDPMPKRPTAVGKESWSPKYVVIDMPQAGQATVLLAEPLFKRASPDYYTGLVGNAALGEGFASRLNREIRIKRGLSYGAGSVLDTRRDAGEFIARAQTKNESAAEVASLIRAELSRLVSEPVQGEELESRQALLTGSYARSMETNFGVAGQITYLLENDLSLDTLDKYIPSINKVTSNDISAFAAKYLKKEPGLIIVGQAPAFIDALKKNLPAVKVIPQNELDLNRAELVKQK